MYQLITAYTDYTSKTEIADLPSIMRALAIYYEEPDFFTAHIINLTTQETIATFTKDWVSILFFIAKIRRQIWNFNPKIKLVFSDAISFQNPKQ